MMCPCLALAVTECMRVVRLSGTYSCLFLIKSLRCKTWEGLWSGVWSCAVSLQPYCCTRAWPALQSPPRWLSERVGSRLRAAAL